jgi:5,10-methylenetetrahydromethanopterin reductase
VDVQGEVVRFSEGRLDFAPMRADLPIYVASNGPLGQRAAGALADGAIMEGCGNPSEARASASLSRLARRRRGATLLASSSWRGSTPA